jgi:hypothetical protein
MPPEKRTTGELLVLIITLTVCAVILIATVGVVVIEAIHPEADTSAAGRAIGGFLSTLTGVAAGFLAGRTDRRNGARRDHE